jgi:hypothetical protein
MALVITLAACSGPSPSGSEPASTNAASAPIATVPASAPPASPSPSEGGTGTPFPYTVEPLAIEPGTYRIAASAWSVSDFTVAFPKGWTVQYGQVFNKHPDTNEEFGFYGVVVDEIFADACEGDTGELLDPGPSVDDLATALLEQPGPMATGPTVATFGGYPTSRVDLTIPAGFDLQACSLGGIGLQIWYSPPADKYFVLLPDGVSNVYILDVDGQRQVFLAGHGLATSDEDLAELQAVLDSIQIGP